MGIRSEDTDAELLKLIAFAHGDHADSTAREAFGELYNRHATWLYGRLWRARAYRLLDWKNRVQDVIQETFYRAYKGANTFDANGITDPSRLEAIVRGWLGGIANRVIADMLRRFTPVPMEPAQLENRHAAWEQFDPESSADSPLIEALQEELQKLSPLQKDILGTTELYYNPGETYQRLPNGVAKALAKRHGTSTENIRQIRRRTMNGLRRRLVHLLEED